MLLDQAIDLFLGLPCECKICLWFFIRKGLGIMIIFVLVGLILNNFTYEEVVFTLSCPTCKFFCFN